MKIVKSTVKEISITNPDDGRNRRKAIFELEDDELGIDSEEEGSQNKEKIKGDSSLNFNLNTAHEKESTSDESSEEETEGEEDSDGKDLHIESSEDEANECSNSKTRTVKSKEISCNKSATKAKFKKREKILENNANINISNQFVDKNKISTGKQKRNITNTVENESEIDDESDELDSFVFKKKKVSHNEEKSENVVR